MLVTSLPCYEAIAEQFSMLPEGEERLKFLVQLGRKLPLLDDSELVEKNLVRGCVSSVWLICERTTEDDESSQRLTLSFRGRSDAQIVSGLVAIVLSRYSGMSPEAILSVKTTSILDGFGLQAHLSPGRRIGLSGMVARIRQFALEAVISEGESDER